mmetsp:Transcript_23741/g.76279  ORF Transcript_23741/g.76279 Transcript_23741/m.76279 type:complete len:274 (-) Transcript_23741:1744-2565(-)
MERRRRHHERGRLSDRHPSGGVYGERRVYAAAVFEYDLQPGDDRSGNQGRLGGLHRVHRPQRGPIDGAVSLCLRPALGPRPHQGLRGALHERRDQLPHGAAPVGSPRPRRVLRRRDEFLHRRRSRRLRYLRDDRRNEGRQHLYRVRPDLRRLRDDLRRHRSPAPLGLLHPALRRHLGLRPLDLLLHGLPRTQLRRRRRLRRDARLLLPGMPSLLSEAEAPLRLRPRQPVPPLLRRRLRIRLRTNERASEKKNESPPNDAAPRLPACLPACLCN